MPERPKPSRREDTAASDEASPRLVSWAGIVFAYLCFALSIATISGAVYVLPLPPKVKVFLVLATGVLASLFVFMAVLTHIVLARRQAGAPGKDREAD